MKKLISAFLAVSICIVSSACSADKTDATDLTGSTSESSAGNITDNEKEPERLYPELPDADYGGYVFTVLTREVTGWDYYLCNHIDIFADTLNGEPVNDAVYIRNSTIEDRYNCKIASDIRDVNGGAYDTALDKAVKSGDGSYDAITIMPVVAVKYLTQGYFYNLAQSKYINLDMPWWNGTANSSLIIGSALYYGFSDLIIMDENGTPTIMFNKTILSDLKMDYPYQTVKDGGWTIDAMHSYMKAAQRDVNGDGEMTPDKDIFGFMDRDDLLVSFVNSAGESIAKLNDSGYPEFTFENERCFSVVQKVEEMSNDSSAIMQLGYKPSTGSELSQMDIFKNGNSLFIWEEAFLAISMRSSETDFGILPLPKYDETQDKYYAPISNYGSSAVAIPCDNIDYDRAGLILEALTAESRYTLIPAYYDILLTTKSVRDDESSEMLDIIFNNIFIDIGVFYDFGGFFTSTLSYIRSGKNDIASYTKKYEKVINAGIDKFIESFK